MLGAAGMMDPLGTLAAIVAVIVVAVVGIVRSSAVSVGLLLAGIGGGATLTVFAIGAQSAFSFGVSGSSRCSAGAQCVAHQAAALSVPALVPSLIVLLIGLVLIWRLRPAG